MHRRVSGQLIPRLRAQSLSSFRTIHVSRVAWSADLPASGSAAPAGSGASSGNNAAGATGGADDHSHNRSSASSEKSGSRDPSYQHNNSSNSTTTTSTTTPEEFPFSPKGPRRRSFRRRPPSTTTTIPVASSTYRGSSVGGRQAAWWAPSGQANGAGSNSGISSSNHPSASGSIRRDATAGYVPVIPETFLQSHYTPAEAIQHDLASIPYSVHRGVQQEVVQTMASCLLAPHSPSTLHRLPAKHNNLVLSSPIPGSSIMLETLTMAAAKTVGADVLTIDVQDIMELTAELGNGRKGASLWPTDHLLRGFNPYSLDALPTAQSPLRGILALDDDDTIEDIMLKIRQEEDEEEEEDEDGLAGMGSGGHDEDEEDEEDEDEDDDGPAIFSSGRRYYVRDPALRGTASSLSSSSSSTSSGAVSLKDKLNRFWTALLVATPPGQTPSTQDVRKPKVLYLKEISDIVHTSAGSVLLPSLMDAVLTVREAGHNVMVVAGHSPSVIQVKDGHGRAQASSLQALGSSGGGSGSGEEVLRDLNEEESKPITGTNVWTVQSAGGGTREDMVSFSGGGGDREEKVNGGNEEQHQQQQQRRLWMALESLTLDRLPGPMPTFHHISIPPYMPLPLAATRTEAEADIALVNQALFEKDQAARIREINVRNLQAVFRFRGGGGGGETSSQQRPNEDRRRPGLGMSVEEVGNDRAVALNVFGKLPGIDREVWGFGKVYRLISMTLGALYLEQQRGAASSLTGNGEDDNHARIRRALVAAMEVHQANTDLRHVLANRARQAAAPKAPKTLVRPRDCTRHERRLLGCIVDPDKIKTTFTNTIIPADTIQALQTMITLPLIRPDIFSHGLLKNEFLPGMLLFGPPGTGKTLLAKAVAKESGARMLEIKASDVFDMYVGEGEKNVAAIFSLARKLRPCVIFLDEVDSIFRARGSAGGGLGGGGGGGSHASQREILNQFMVEWDGLRSSGQNQGIVVMASTNRPYELDDAVLRRLPRRILVDLPDEAARAQILGVYLRQEQLDGSVDVQALARRTRLFSGSDLKNLCVSAVLAAVREAVEQEVAVAAESSGLERVGLEDSRIGGGGGGGQKTLNLAPLLEKYRQESRLGANQGMTGTAAPTRVLTMAHFEKAFQQITPSCSEDMSSLVELRKWDGLYGDGGKQRRKVLKTLGFDVEGEPPRM